MICKFCHVYSDNINFIGSHFSFGQMPKFLSVFFFFISDFLFCFWWQLVHEQSHVTIDIFAVIWCYANASVSKIGSIFFFFLCWLTIHLTDLLNIWNIMKHKVFSSSHEPIVSRCRTHRPPMKVLNHFR